MARSSPITRRFEPRLIVTNRERVIERLADNQDDFVIMGQAPDDLAVEARPFYENLLVVAAHPAPPAGGDGGDPAGPDRQRALAGARSGIGHPLGLRSSI
ncbi:MAG: LysR substrate-binding domain-containing protein [Rhodopseudomonas palustris]|nr:LysR substrate-binding domain-containing protein [Rhodopseudomonas palustris]